MIDKTLLIFMVVGLVVKKGLQIAMLLDIYNLLNKRCCLDASSLVCQPLFVKESSGVYQCETCSFYFKTNSYYNWNNAAETDS